MNARLFSCVAPRTAIAEVAGVPGSGEGEHGKEPLGDEPVVEAETRNGLIIPCVMSDQG
jgi:hypothetical protein